MDTGSLKSMRADDSVIAPMSAEAGLLGRICPDLAAAREASPPDGQPAGLLPDQPAGDHDSAVQPEDCHEVYDDGVLRITRSGIPPVLAIAGEIDESTYPGLVGTLEKFVDGQAEVHASLAGIEYCDLAGLRTIIRLAGGCGGPDSGRRRLVLYDVPPELTNILRIMGWDMAPGLVREVPGPESPGLPG